MFHWKLTLAYDGTHYHGWQVQPELLTIQGCLADAIARVVGERVLPQGSGRTDAGVHALHQVASFVLTVPIPSTNLMRALNRTLPPSIRVLHAVEVSTEFHARHSARRKTYQYRMFPTQERSASTVRICSPFLAPYVWDCPWAFDLQRASDAAAHVVGEHDFTSFAAVDPERSEEAGGVQKDAVRTIFASEWVCENDLFTYKVTGSGFLHHMVRNLVGTFVDVAAGRMEPEKILTILAAKNRSMAGPTAPARGLFLTHVEYGAE